MNVQDFIASKGFDFQPTQLDGTFHDFQDKFGNKGWYIGRTLPNGKITLTFGDWRRPNANHSFITNDLTQEEKNELQQAQADFIKEKISRQTQAKKLAQDIFHRWEKKGSLGTSLYLEKKKLPQTPPGCIVKPSDPGHAVIVPMWDEFGEIWNFQTIFDSGDKLYFNYARVEGLFFEFPRSDTATSNWASSTFVCEGFATGYALALATGARVVCALTLGNLKHVAPHFPEAILALDNDASTKERMEERGNEAPVNPGYEFGGRLAKELGLRAVMPPGDTSLDYSDLWVSGGRDAVLAGLVDVDLSKFDSVKTPPPAQAQRHPIIGRWVNGLEPMDLRYGKNGKVILPEEMEVAERLFTYYDGNLVKFEMDTFVWSGKHWRPFDTSDENHVMQQIMVLHSGHGTYTRFRNVYKCFMELIPHTKRNMFYVNPHRITFNNGTLAIDYTKDSWTISFREHRKDDFSTNLIPYNYDPEAKNPVFEETIRNILGDAEFDTKLRAVKQMYGSCLAPLYPRLFLLVGKPGSGKSTLIILASALVSDGNVCSVQPADFHGFNMEPMAGKLVNAVTDLNVAKPISDEVVKQIEDRIPIAINRKHKSIIRAPFPAVHIFGANDIPPTLERGSMAHTRRWTFIPCSHFQRDSSEHDKHRIDRIREAGMPGVINFAIEGLKDLLASRGQFFVPESGKEKMQKWQTENDPIASFFEAIREGEVKDLTLDAGARCYTKVLWEEFGSWHEDAYNARPRIPKMKFYSRVEKSLSERSKYQGDWIFRGVASKKSPVRSGGGEKKNPSGDLESDGSGSDAGCKAIENSNDLF